MKKWREYPFLLIRRLCLMLLAGFICIGVGVVGYLAAGDRILFSLSVAVCVCSIANSILLWRLIKGNRYEVVKGVCVGISSPPFRRYKKIKIMDENGIESGLLIHNQARVRIGYHYCFLFKKKADNIFNSEYLTTMLATDHFLGYEELGEYMEPAGKQTT